LPNGSARETIDRTVDEADRVIVPDELRKCVCFIYYDDEHGVRRPAGTAFFTCAPRGYGLDGYWVYLVTAKHVLNGIRRDDLTGNCSSA
jgi:hypothetical protein